jgi:hypothetical protein
VFLGAPAVHELLLMRMKQQLWEVAADLLEGEVQDMMGLLPRKQQTIATAATAAAAITTAAVGGVAGTSIGGGGGSSQPVPLAPPAAAAGAAVVVPLAASSAAGGGLGQSLALGSGGSGLSGSSSAVSLAAGGGAAAAAGAGAGAQPIQDPRQRLYAVLSMLLLDRVVASSNDGDKSGRAAVALVQAASGGGVLQGLRPGGGGGDGSGSGGEEGLWGLGLGSSGSNGGSGARGAGEKVELEPYLQSLRALVLQHVQKSQQLQHLIGEGGSAAVGGGGGSGGVVGSGGGGGRGGSWLAHTLIGALVMQLLHSSVHGVLRQELDAVLVGTAQAQQELATAAAAAAEAESGKAVVPLTLLPHQQSGYCSALQLLPARGRGGVAGVTGATGAGSGYGAGCVGGGGGAASVAWGGPGWGGDNALLVVMEREVGMESVAAALGEGGWYCMGRTQGVLGFRVWVPPLKLAAALEEGGWYCTANHSGAQGLGFSTRACCARGKSGEA